MRWSRSCRRAGGDGDCVMNRGSGTAVPTRTRAHATTAGRPAGVTAASVVRNRLQQGSAQRASMIRQRALHGGPRSGVSGHGTWKEARMMQSGCQGQERAAEVPGGRTHLSRWLRTPRSRPPHQVPTAARPGRDARRSTQTSASPSHPPRQTSLQLPHRNPLLRHRPPHPHLPPHHHPRAPPPR